MGRRYTKTTLAELAYIEDIDPIKLYNAAREGRFSVSKTAGGATVIAPQEVANVRQLAAEGAFDGVTEFDPSGYRDHGGLRG